jgi:hypothetical protein
MELTSEQLQELKDTLKDIGAYLPENKANYIWNTYNHVRDAHEMQPCMCGSAGGHWKRAVDFLHDYIKDK